MSIDRRRLNELLISAAEKYPHVHWNFGHKLTTCDLDAKTLTFERTDTKTISNSTFDVVMACDGAFSNVRTQFMKCSKMSYSQEFIEDGYMELRIPPDSNGQFMMEKNYLHIWPRHTFMMIGLPNVQDSSFVVTIFMPFKIFESLDEDQKVIDFFSENFCDALKLMGKDFVVDAFRRLSPLPLVSIKCQPYNYKDCCVLMGDAAHAMVPFYGQGLNCGLEDVLIFKNFMNLYDSDFEKVLNEFSAHRSVDAHCINDLAMGNYVEMRSDVNKSHFYLRKRIDTLLYHLIPKTWIPLYTMVAFTRIRYHECLKDRRWQDDVLQRLAKISLVALSTLAAYAISRSGWIDTVIDFYQWIRDD